MWDVSHEMFLKGTLSDPKHLHQLLKSKLEKLRLNVSSLKCHFKMPSTSAGSHVSHGGIWRNKVGIRQFREEIKLG